MSNSKYGNSPLATLMGERGLNQSGLSLGCGVSQPAISRFLKGDRGMSISSLMKISSFFLVDMGTLCASTEGANEALLRSSLRLDIVQSYCGKATAGEEVFRIKSAR